MRPLIRRWRVVEKEHSGRRFRFFEDGEVVLVCGGIGAGPARRAAEAVIELYAPEVIYSAGFAGALDPQEKVGYVVHPRRVVDASDGSSVTLDGGDGVLVTWPAVADAAQKAKLRRAFSAHLVDMEAAAVARAAQARGIRFEAVKVISDDSEFEFPFVSQFVDAEGKFSEARFALFAALRPWLWPRVLRLSRNSAHAAPRLCLWLSQHLAGKTSSPIQPNPRRTEVINRQ